MNEGSVAEPPSCSASLPPTTPSTTHTHVCQLAATPKQDASVSSVQLPTNSMVAKTTQPLHPSIATTLVDAVHSHDQQSNDYLASCTRVTKEEKDREGRKGGREKRRKEEKTRREEEGSTR